LLGLAIIAIVIALDASTLLQGLDWTFYDWRVRLCQFYRKPPTDRLVHIDIDDGALETVGRWPWPRNYLADVVDELGQAGAKVVAFDVLLSEPEEPKLQPSGDVIDHDAQLADAIRRMGSVLVPASLIFESPALDSPAVAAAEDDLMPNLELTREQVNQRLVDRKFELLDQDQFAHALRMAIDRRIRQELASNSQIPTDDLIAKLLPQLSHFVNHNAPAVRTLLHELALVQADRALDRFMLPMPQPSISCLHGNGVIAPIPVLAAAARYGGSVDQIPLSDGVLRKVPLVAEFRGKLLPQISLVLACAAMNIDVHTVRFTQDRVVIPHPDGFDITISVSYQSTKFGRVGMFMEVPWFGSGDWTRMYHGRGGQHLNVGVLLDLADLRRRMVTNNRFVDERLGILFNAIPDSKLKSTADAFKAQHFEPADFNSRKPFITATLGNDYLKFIYDSVIEKKKQTPDQLSDDEKAFLSHVSGLRDVLEQAPMLVQQLKDRSSEVQQQIRGRVALIGETASSATDMINTPLHKMLMPGVIAHGVVLNGILVRELWRLAPPWVGWLYTLGLGALATLAVTYLSPSRAAVAVAGVLLAFLALNGLVLFDRGNYLIDTAGPVTAVVSILVLENLVSLIVETAAHARVTNRFRTRVDPQLVDFVLENPKRSRLEGHIKELTVIFTDLEGFTAVSEKLREETVEVLNEYFKRMVPLIHKPRSSEYGGYLNKLLGDGIMIVFGAPYENPNHAVDAIDSVLDMIQETERFSQEMVARGLPPVVMRAGINTGPMMIGDAGGQTASDYTALGDAVNTAARFEKANKRFDSRVLIGGGTERHLNGKFITRPLGSLMLAGKSEVVEGFEVLARVTEATDEQRDLARHSQQVVATFASGDVPACLKAIEQMRAALGPSKFLAVYEQQCQQALEDQASLQKYVLA
jgi:class 3 adenylate cyclase/CHASE2 domain-containing sensor protein